MLVLEKQQVTEMEILLCTEKQLYDYLYDFLSSKIWCGFHALTVFLHFKKDMCYLVFIYIVTAYISY